MNNKNSVYLDKVSKSNKAFDIKEDEKLLLEAPKESIEILQTINLTHHVNKVKKKFNQLNAITQLSNKFNRRVVLGSDVKKLCLTYDLKLCKAEHFLAEVDESLAIEINKFIKENTFTEVKEVRERIYYIDNEGKKQWRYGDGITEEEVTKCKVQTTSRNFFILAPSENFIYDGSKLKNATLFYREHDNEEYAQESDHFVELYSWGDNYSESRMLNYMFNIYEYKNLSDELPFRTAIIYNIITLTFVSSFCLGTQSFEALIVLNSVVTIIMLLNLSLEKNTLKHIKTWNKNNF